MSKHRSATTKRFSMLLLVGELLITAGVVLGSYVVYELWFSNIAAKQTWTNSSNQVRTDFDSEFKKFLDKNPSVLPSQIDLTQTPKSGKAFGLLYVPKLWGTGRVVPIVEGVSDRDLASGLGHYPNTQLPNDTGNFAIAGHRATHGEPFGDFQLLEIGDEIVVETLAGKYVYELVGDIKVLPQDVWVIDSKPNVSSLANLPADSKLITLTTCDPRWSSEKRWIWFGVQKSFTSRAELEGAPT